MLIFIYSSLKSEQALIPEKDLASAGLDVFTKGI